MRIGRGMGGCVPRIEDIVKLKKRGRVWNAKKLGIKYIKQRIKDIVQLKKTEEERGH